MYAQPSRKTRRTPCSWITSSPPSRPAQKFQGLLSARAISKSASARRRAPAINSSRERGVWRTPLGTSTPTTSNWLRDLAPRWPGVIVASASRIASSLGRRVLPTAMMMGSMCRAVLSRSNRGAQFPFLGFRQREHSENHKSVRGRGEHRNRMPERHRLAQIANQRRENCADPAAKVVREPLAGTAQGAGEQFSEKRADGTEDT